MMVSRKFATFLAVLMLAVAVACRQPLASSRTASGFQYETSIDTSLEYSNGSLGSPYEGLSLWYDWVNTNNTRTVFLAYYSYKHNPPIITFLGQNYYVDNSTEIFVGNILALMEIYNDTNGNGLPDADYQSGTSEIRYSFMVNSSESFSIAPVEKVVMDGFPHYRWGIRYQTIDGFIMTEDQSTGARVIIEYMDFSYDFFVQSNVSYLKTNFGIGEITNMTQYGVDTVSLEGLSIALLYETVTITTKPYVTVVNGNPYNSTTAPASVNPASSSEIRIGDAKAYEFLFGQNYTLYRGSEQEVFESKSTAVSNQSVSGVWRRSIEWVLSDLEGALSNLFPKISGLQVQIDLDVAVSSFLYRVCYPKWDGNKIEHDPTYVAYLYTATVPELGSSILIVAVVVVAGLLSLAAALFDLRKTRRVLTIAR